MFETNTAVKTLHATTIDRALTGRLGVAPSMLREPFGRDATCDPGEKSA